ncbi:Palmitoyltransferase ZDHHC2 [Araneus ventricosus]|uniref:Palmitoyltransferase n=1 Tax=Araneus ventricosus TaxID=182803 RepID=A0A4Y2CG51_ARAVE|nr:Palmitoyltransferase ZDHHC2 [Araneus ventricosus]
MGIECTFCVRLFKWFPVVFIATIVGWSYYAYVVQLCLFAVESVVEKVFYLIIYHAIFAMFLWSYWQTIFTNIGTVPRQFKLPPAEAVKLERDQSEDNQRRMLESFAKDLPVSCRTMNGSIRYCEKCCNIKPDRAHHCSVCGVCVLKMDHHCPWVNNCVSFTNYKYFILFLGYALLYCLFISATSLQYFIKLWTNNLEGPGRFHILVLFFVAVMFAVSLVSLFGYHCYLVSVNRSTLESFRPPIFRTGPDKDGFSLGRKANFTEIFGADKSKWFIPVQSRHSRDNVVLASMPVIKQRDTNEDCAKTLASTENKLAEDANTSFIGEKSVKDRCCPKQGVKLVNGDLLPTKVTQIKENETKPLL